MSNHTNYTSKAYGPAPKRALATEQLRPIHKAKHLSGRTMGVRRFGRTGRGHGQAGAHSISAFSALAAAALGEKWTPERAKEILEGKRSKTRFNKRGDGILIRSPKVVISETFLLTKRQAAKKFRKLERAKWQADLRTRIWGLREHKSGKIVQKAEMTYVQANQRNKPHLEKGGSGYQWVLIPN